MKNLEDWHIKAIKWADEHESHVNEMIKNANLSYPPSMEDKNQPNLWKPQHWYWFVHNISANDN